MPAEQSNERVKRYTIFACVEDGCRYYRDTLSTGVHVAGLEGRVKHKVAPVEVIPAESPNVLSVEEARFLLDAIKLSPLALEKMAERYHGAMTFDPRPGEDEEREATRTFATARRRAKAEVAALTRRLSDFAEEADRG